jgi:FkbM family methyltransferase
MKQSFRTNAYLRKIKAFNEFLDNARRSKFKALMKLISENEIEVVIDIGANVGQFALDLRRAGYLGDIISFEPVSKTFVTLSRNSAREKRWRVFDLAIGSRVSKEFINISNNDSLSSSFRDMNKLHLSNFPKSYFSSEELVSVSTLDRQLNILKISPAKCLLKIDVQGFERDVLAGGINSIPLIPVCFIEGSLSPLYDGEYDLRELLNKLHDLGHNLFELFPGVRAKNGKLLQVDIISTNLESD